MLNARESREKLMSDPYRPVYHFVLPEGEEVLSPNDPNGAFYADGVYHLMYLYRNTKQDGHHWGHMISRDLLHWRHMPDSLVVQNGDGGCFSGGGFVDDDKTAYITFWKLPKTPQGPGAGGVALAYAKAPYDKWERIEPIAVSATVQGIKDVEIDGEVVHLGCCDPSNIWKIDNKYYMQLGNNPVLDEYGRADNSPVKYQGGWTELYRSDDLKTWEYLHRFYDVEPRKKDGWPDKTEDAMCASFLPLFDAESNGNKTDKWLQLFIAHNRGCQYFVGNLKNEKFYPEVHGRMSWEDRTYFAPEALIDDKNRQIMWAWLRDNPEYAIERYGWRGVYALPRAVWWEDDMLKMAPVEELEMLQYNHQVFNNINSNSIPVKNGEVFRLKAVWDIKENTKAGFKIRVSDDGTEYTEVYYDRKSQKLVADNTKSGTEGELKSKEQAPFELMDGEKLTLDIFVDKSVVEVYVNNRQAVCRRIYPTRPENSMGVEVIGNVSEIESIDVWEMMACNPY